MPRLQTQEIEGALVVRFNDARILDNRLVDQISTELNQLLSNTFLQRLLLNFAGVTFLSSSMIGQISILHQRCKKRGIKLKLCEVAQPIMEAFRVLRLHKMLDICATQDDALAAFNKKGWFR